VTESTVVAIARTVQCFSVRAREYKSREVAQSPIYVIVHSLLEVSFCIGPTTISDR